MKTQTKFNINDLVQHKFTNNKTDVVNFMEVIEIQMQICYGGKQEWYLCREMQYIYFPQDHGGAWVFGQERADKGKEYKKYRADELIPVSKEFREKVEKAQMDSP